MIKVKELIRQLEQQNPDDVVMLYVNGGEEHAGYRGIQVEVCRKDDTSTHRYDKGDHPYSEWMKEREYYNKPQFVLLRG